MVMLDSHLPHLIDVVQITNMHLVVGMDNLDSIMDGTNISLLLHDNGKDQFSISNPFRFISNTCKYHIKKARLI